MDGAGEPRRSADRAERERDNDNEVTAADWQETDTRQESKERQQKEWDSLAEQLSGYSKTKVADRQLSFQNNNYFYFFV